jgi:hypothetical protein
MQAFFISSSQTFTNEETAVTTHQSNYAKILSLRATSAELDAQIRENLLLLTKTRSELIATPSTTLPDTTNHLSYSELLSYARRISKYSLPPSYREPDREANAEANSNTPKEASTQTHTNGNSTPTVIPSMNGVERQLHPTTAREVDTTPAPLQTGDDTRVKANMDIWNGYLGRGNDIGWTPWPTPDAIRSGALASIQILVDQGIDPATFDPEKGAELEAERKRIMEEEDLKREQEQVRMEEERRKEMERRMSLSGARSERVQEQPKVFQLETFDDDDDDE